MRQGAGYVGFVPKLDTEPYFQVAQTGAEEAAKEIGGKAIKQAPSHVSENNQVATEIENDLIKVFCRLELKMQTASSLLT